MFSIVTRDYNFDNQTLRLFKYFRESYILQLSLIFWRLLTPWIILQTSPTWPNAWMYEESSVVPDWCARMILTRLHGHVFPLWPDGSAILVCSYTVVVTDHLLVVVVQYIHNEQQGSRCSWCTVWKIKSWRRMREDVAGGTHQATACYVTFVHGCSHIYRTWKLLTSLSVQEARILKCETWEME